MQLRKNWKSSIRVQQLGMENTGCNSERIESEVVWTETELHPLVDATQKELKVIHRSNKLFLNTPAPMQLRKNWKLTIKA